MNKIGKISKNKPILIRGNLEGLFIKYILESNDYNNISGYYSDDYIVITKDNVDLLDCIYIGDTVFNENVISYSTSINCLNHVDNELLINNAYNPNTFRYINANKTPLKILRFNYPLLYFIIGVLERDGCKINIDLNKELPLNLSGLKYIKIGQILNIFKFNILESFKIKELNDNWLNWLYNIFYEDPTKSKIFLFEEELNKSCFKVNKNIAKKFNDFLWVNFGYGDDLTICFDIDKINKSVYGVLNFIFGVDKIKKFQSITKVYKLEKYLGDINKKRVIKPFFVNYITKERVLVSYNIKEIYGKR